MESMKFREGVPLIIWTTAVLVESLGKSLIGMVIKEKGEELKIVNVNNS